MSRFAFAGIIIPFVVLGQQQQHHQQHHQQSALDAEVSIQERPQVQTTNRSAARYMRNGVIESNECLRIVFSFRDDGTHHRVR